MDNEAVVQLYKGILFSHNNEFESVLVRYNLEPVIQNEVRKKKTNTALTRIWNLKKQWWTYLQGRNGDADVESGLVDTVGEGEIKTNGEISINIYIYYKA